MSPQALLELDAIRALMDEACDRADALKHHHGMSDDDVKQLTGISHILRQGLTVAFGLAEMQRLQGKTGVS